MSCLQGALIWRTGLEEKSNSIIIVFLTGLGNFGVKDKSYLRLQPKSSDCAHYTSSFR